MNLNPDKSMQILYLKRLVTQFPLLSTLFLVNIIPVKEKEVIKHKIENIYQILEIANPFVLAYPPLFLILESLLSFMQLL